jgi:hypothetical protein
MAHTRREYGTCKTQIWHIQNASMAHTRREDGTHKTIEVGTHKTVQARLWPWLSGESPSNLKLFPRRSEDWRRKGVIARRGACVGDLVKLMVELHFLIPGSKSNTCMCWMPHPCALGDARSCMPNRFRAKRTQSQGFWGYSPENQGQNLATGASCVPYSLGVVPWWKGSTH